MATCFDSIESSSGHPKNRSNLSHFYCAFWDPERSTCFGRKHCPKHV